MANEHETEAALDAALAEARVEAPGPDLVARVLADAALVQAAQAAEAAATVQRPHRGWFAGLVDAVGGWGAVTGVTAAGIVGLAVGLAAPDTIGGWLENGNLPTAALSGYGVTPDLSALMVEAGDV